MVREKRRWGKIRRWGKLNLHLHDAVLWGNVKILGFKNTFCNTRGLVTLIIDWVATFVIVKYTLLPKIVRAWSDSTSVTIHRWTKLHKGTIRFIVLVLIFLTMNAVLKFASWQLTGIWK